MTTIRDRAEVTVHSGVIVLGAGSTANASSENVMLEGNWDNRGTCPVLFDWTTGGLTLSGSTAQRFEVAGRDVWQSRVGLGSAADSNFSMGLVEILPGRDVTFANAFYNGITPQPLCGEALYVHKLTLGTGSAVTFDDCRVYYDLLIDEGATITRIGCGDLQPLPSGDTNGDQRVDLHEWDLLRAWCLRGPGPSPVPVPADCLAFDFDADRDFDLADVAWFQRLFNGP